MGLFMDTGSVKSQLNQMNIHLAEVINQAMRLQGSVSAFTETTQQLQGESYDSIRNYYSSTHLPALRGLICHVEELKAANDKYASQIDTYLGGISYVDEDGLGNSLDMIILAREQVAAMTEVTAYMRIYDNLLAAMQRGIEDKINKIACFKAATSGIYSTLESDKGLLQTGIACMEGIGFNSKTKTFSMQGINLMWSQEIDKKWTDRQVAINKQAAEYLSRLEEKIPDITEEDLEKLSEYAEKAPDVEIPEMLLDFLSDTVPNFIKATGGSLIKLGSSGLIYGLEGEYSFIMAGSSEALSKSVNTMKLGNTLSKVGKGIGWTLVVASFIYGMYDDMENDDKTFGEAVTHNIFTTGVSMGAGTLLTEVSLAFFAGTPAGWTILGAAALGVAAGTGASYLYDNNVLGIRDGLDWLGGKIDEGINWVGNKVNDGVNAIGEVAGSIWDTINPFDGVW